MTIQTFLAMLAALSTLTSLLTQAIKTLLNDSKRTYSSNLIVLLVSLATGAGGVGIYHLLSKASETVDIGVMMALMALAVWLCSMYGYDKIGQLVKQIAQIGDKTWDTTDKK